VEIDTTGLAPHTTFGPTASLNPTTGGAATHSTGEPGTADIVSAAGAAEGPLKVGQAFGPRYHIIKLLGIGGMGAVYQAWDAELSVAVALKVIRTSLRRGVTAAAEKQFKNELLLARQVTHKHVVRIHDISEIDGIKYITMPYVQGDDLATVMRRDGKLPIARALRIARQIAGGLQAAHDAGVVHRDLKPPNIMIGGAADGEQALIMDFGISASTDAATGGTIVGTLEYMSPEQGTGGAVDARSDVYAFGLILYEMFAGPRPAAPRDGQARVEAMKRRVADGLPPLRAIDDTIPEPLAAIVTRCLERDPAARFQTTGELVAALVALDNAGELIPLARRITTRMMILVAALVAVLISGTYLIGRRTAPAAPPAHEPVSVLIADFANRSGDPLFDGTVEQTLAIALEEASYITVFKTRDARAIAARLAPDKSTRITQEMGALIARREGLKVMVAGAIEKRPDGYRLDVRASDAAVGKVIVTAQQDVKDKQQVLKTVASMATQVRAALGESKTEMAKIAAAETVTAASLEAMRAYAHAQELQHASKFREALEEYQHAAQLDPQFGRAYAGMAGVYANYFKQPDKAEENYQAALKHLDRMTEREKYRTLGTYYLDIARNYEKAIENFETLVKLYPADQGGHGNLALAYLLIGNNVPRAVAEVRKTIAIYPANTVQRYNYAMYSMYAGDFPTAIAEGSRLNKENPSFEYNFIPIALSQLAQGDPAGSRDTWARLAQVSPFGSSVAQQGLADLEMYFGRDRAAIRLLRDAIAADQKQKRAAGVAQKSVALAEALLALGDRRQAAQAAENAITLTRHESTLFPAARVLLHAGDEAAAAQVATDLEKMLQRHTTAYARLITGEIALARGRTGDAIDAFRDAQKRHDSWFGRFLLGKTYADAGHFPEALAELELCMKRRGETADVFFYDLPTLRYLPPAYYWYGRAQEGVGATTEARKAYQQFLDVRRDADPSDPLAADARRRLSLP
jgi:tetratricopeptide (TPR) repeat protein